MPPQRGDSGDAVKALQRDLRALGYLASGIDGQFGSGTELAVKGLQHDLLNNAGAGTDGNAPVRVLDYNRGRVVNVDGVVAEALADCAADMMGDDAFPKLPASDDPVAANTRARAELANMRSTQAPIPFLLGILGIESGLRHFQVPRGADEDNYVAVGLDRNATKKYVVTSRGYGMGQFTLFHHPPTHDEVRDFIVSASGNVSKAIGELSTKFNEFVTGNTSGTRADDRIHEVGEVPLRPCQYAPSDPRYMTDCKNCLQAAGACEIRAGETPFYEGSSHIYEVTQYYKKTLYRGVPVRKNIPCDWPYAVRRYNGAGTNSYHYQTKVLLAMVDK
jgi:hypothetical protein